MAGRKNDVSCIYRPCDRTWIDLGIEQYALKIDRKRLLNIISAASFLWALFTKSGGQRVYIGQKVG